MEKDVVCGMTIDPKSAIKTEHNGKLYYFCNEGCKKQFESDPSKYL